ncbi:MAG: hypothetical protein KGY70_19725, partial [Bacteroidales bacterium]|nr:hypothetical protein [Bacteroidales bacterium]
MKRLSSILVALLFVTGMTLAQTPFNEAEVTQNGDDQTSEITQTAKQNFAYTNQFGELNEAYVIQETGGNGFPGGKNESNIDQGSEEMGATENWANVFQLTNYGGGENLSNIVQDGTDNEADVEQYTNDADLNESNITQDVEGNDADVLQRGNYYGGSNESNITQLGITNEADISQITNFGGENTSTVVQGSGYAEGNKAEVTQLVAKFGRTGSGTNTSEISQFYHDNEAIVDQKILENGGTNISDIYQSRSSLGNGNFAKVKQKTKYGNSGGGGMNESDIVQKGENNEINVGQGTNGAEHNKSDVLQEGDDNMVDVKQGTYYYAGTNISDVDQIGSSNEAYVDQRARRGGTNESIILQDGDS